MAGINEVVTTSQLARAIHCLWCRGPLSFTTLGGRLFHLQIVNGDQYVAEAAATRTMHLLPASRGLVFDRRGRPVVVNVPSWTVKIRPADLPAEDALAVLRRVASLVKGRCAAGCAPSRVRRTSWSPSNAASAARRRC